MAQIFLSYSRIDRRFVEALADKLRRIYGHDNVWFDEGLHGGDIWWEEILEQIASRDIFIYVLSNDSVQSDYCKAEFTEARRLQKQIITVQARDRTRLTDELGDIHYINMANGVDDADALTDLFRSVNKRMTKVPKRAPKPLWEPATPRPRKLDEKPRPTDAPDVETPTLEVPLAERENVRVEGKPWWKKQEFIIGAILVPIIAAVLGAVIQNMGDNPTSPATAEVAQLTTDNPTPTADVAQDDARATGAAQAYATLTALAPTNTPTITLTPTDTPISSSDIQRTAQAEIFATETSAAGTQVVIAQQTQNAVMTEQFIAGATATYIAVLSLTPPATNTLPPTNTPVPPTFTPTPTLTPPPTDTPDPLQAAFTPVTRNADWTPHVVTFDDDPAGAEMVVVPVGSFEMGSPTNESGRDSDEAPHPQQVTTPYFIDRYEVTNAQFAAFLNDSPEARDNRSEDGFEYIDTDDEDARIRQNGDRWEVIPGYENHPVTEVTWFGGRDFCAGRGMSLPTELQWEYAASGPSNWVYPWGNEWNPDNAVWGGNNPSDTLTDVVGSKPDGASWVGAHDMSGNVWEWVSSLYADYPYDEDHESNTNDNSSRVLRGGSWYLVVTNNLRSAFRYDLTPVGASYGWDFRCARLN